MRLIVKQNKKGFTLVEVMIALTILLFVFLALMQTALVSIDSNMTNMLRDEAVLIAEERMSEARNISALATDTVDANLGGGNCPTNFTGIFGTTGLLVQRSFRNIASFNFCTNRTVTAIPATNGTQITISVWWQWKEQQFNQVVSTERR